MTGNKYDEGKPNVGLCLADFAGAILEVSKVTSYGLNKYGSPSGWKDVPDNISRYSSAMLRHWLAYAQGEIVDPESRQLHLAHAAWNCLAILQISLRNAQEGLESK